MQEWLGKRRIKQARFIFLVGAMKSGTSSLAAAMGEHAGIVLGTLKEPAYFASKRQHIIGAASYLKNWKMPMFQAPYRLDASTNYTKFPGFGDAAAGIASATTGAKIIYIMRDPIERIESQIAHNISGSADKAERYRNSCDEIGFYHHDLVVSSYATQLEKYRAQFPRSDILPLVFEEMLAAPEETLERIWSFLGLAAPAVPITLGRKNIRRAAPKDLGGSIFPPHIPAQLREILAPEMEKLKTEWGIAPNAWSF